jgi:hypothetical protein
MRLQPEHEFQRIVDGTLLAGSKTAHVTVEAVRVDGSELLDKHAGHISGEDDFRTKGRRGGAARRRGDDDRRQAQQGVGLHDDAVPWASLLVAAARREPHAVHVAAGHSGQSADAASMSAMTA